MRARSRRDLRHAQDHAGRGARSSLGLQECLYLGNLDARRDWGHAREYVRGMWLMLQQDVPDDYVLATGVTTPVRQFVKWAFERRHQSALGGYGLRAQRAYDAVDGRCRVAADPRCFGRLEVDLLLGDPSKAAEKLNWHHELHIRDPVREMTKADLDADAGRSRFREGV